MHRLQMALASTAASYKPDSDAIIGAEHFANKAFR
jgi:hypothetical protein